MNDDMTVTLDDALAEMDPLGRALFEAGTERAIGKKKDAKITALQQRITELEAEVGQLKGDETPAG